MRCLRLNEPPPRALHAQSSPGFVRRPGLVSGHSACLFFTFAFAGLASSCAHLQQPDYASMIALRSSSGFQRALDAANRQLSLDANDGTAAAVRALVYANGVDFLGMAPSQAHTRKLRALAQAMRLARTNPWTRAAYGLIHQADDPSSAEDELMRCIAEHPDFLECYNLYGDLLRKTGREEEAGAVYRRALKRWPTDGELLVSYSLYLQETGQVAMAIAVLTNLTRQQPSYARGHWHLAVMLYQAGGDLGLVRREADRALALDPLIWNGKRLLKLLHGA